MLALLRPICARSARGRSDRGQRLGAISKTSSASTGCASYAPKSSPPNCSKRPSRGRATLSEMPLPGNRVAAISYAATACLRPFARRCHHRGGEALGLADAAQLALEHGGEVFAGAGLAVDPRAEGTNDRIKQGQPATETGDIIPISRRLWRRKTCQRGTRSRRRQRGATP